MSSPFSIRNVTLYVTKTIPHIFIFYWTLSPTSQICSPVFTMIALSRHLHLFDMTISYIICIFVSSYQSSYATALNLHLNAVRFFCLVHLNIPFLCHAKEKYVCIKARIIVRSVQVPCLISPECFDVSVFVNTIISKFVSICEISLKFSLSKAVNIHL